MRPLRFLLAIPFCALTVQAASAATVDSPAVVELFTSQGCSSCPPANANLIALASRPDVLALSFDVTYWDYLGWKDTFDQEIFTQRQRDYERPLGEAGPFTPQVVVDGRKDAVGNVRSEVEALIAQSHRAEDPPALHLDGNSVSVSAGKGEGDVWLVRYDPRIVEVAIARGENSGTTQPQRNVVHQLVKLGRWQGVAAHFALPPAAPGLKTAVILQQPQGGPIISAARD
ncbi:MAG TPA: DUF1223 domain-containing protein [Rhizomicrobium sp.]|nr:DUF1223 domain-containing protein [Rhizomicrobium sp.]